MSPIRRRRHILHGVLCAAVVILSGPGCSGRPGGEPLLSAFRAVDSLRVSGRHEAALAVLRHAVPIDRETARWPWRAREAARLDSALERIARLPPESRRAANEADSLDDVIRRLMTVDENYIGAMGAAARQLNLRCTLLGPEDADVATSLDHLGRIAYACGEGLQAEQYLDEAVRIRRSRLGRDDPRVAESLRQLGVVFEERRARSDADSCFFEARDIAEAAYAPDDAALAPILESVGSHYRRWADFRTAETYYRRALAIRRARFGPHSQPVAENLLWLGHSELCAGELNDAARALSEARSLFVAAGQSLGHPMGDATLFLGTIAWLRRDNATAIREWDLSYRCRTNTPQNHPQGYGLKRLGGLRSNWIDAQLASGNPDEAWSEVYRGSGPVAHSLLQFARLRRRHPEASARLDSLRAEVVEMRGDLSDLAISGRTGTRAGRVPLLARLARAEADRMVAEQALVGGIPEVTGDHPRLDDLQTHLKPDQAMVGWVNAKWSWPGKTQRWSAWAWVVRRDGPVSWVHYGEWSDPKKYVDWFHGVRNSALTLEKASQWPHRVAADPSLDSLCALAGARILTPLLPHLDGITELIVAGRPGPFLELALSPECYRDSGGRTFNERFAFAYTPSPGVFVELAESRHRAPVNGVASILAVADPLGSAEASGGIRDPLETASAGAPSSSLIDPTLFRNAIAGDREALARLPALPFSRAEIRDVASDFDHATLLEGPAANERALVAALRSTSFQVLHLATHALIDIAEPDRSTLVLAPADPRDNGLDPANDGRITAEEVLLGWNLDSDLVTLSGCRTSQGHPARGGEDLGFEQAFLTAGAGSLLTSRWPVDDRATALLMSRFYENLTGSFTDTRLGVSHGRLTRARALQEAQLWLRDLKDREGRATFAHPVYWAGFVLTGGPEGER